jgi:hypothetical protein
MGMNEAYSVLRSGRIGFSQLSDRDEIVEMFPRTSGACSIKIGLLSHAARIMMIPGSLNKSFQTLISSRGCSAEVDQCQETLIFLREHQFNAHGTPFAG